MIENMVVGGLICLVSLIVALGVYAIFLQPVTVPIFLGALFLFWSIGAVARKLLYQETPK